ncbi:hypothetical protein RAS1_20800 [Phycisphaerae bacterium RAS1]|nr:hypothetical protein RAS1_20800 [Phycisphaerae bacterium RAS1]
MAAKPRSPVEIRREGFRALVERLGAADAIRFLHQYDSGEGDYTRQRQAALAGLTVNELLREIEAREQSDLDK